jgi:protein-disulfide isomerase
MDYQNRQKSHQGSSPALSRSPVSRWQRVRLVTLMFILGILATGTFVACGSAPQSQLRVPTATSGETNNTESAADADATDTDAADTEDADTEDTDAADTEDADADAADTEDADTEDADTEDADAADTEDADADAADTEDADTEDTDTDAADTEDTDTDAADADADTDPAEDIADESTEPQSLMEQLVADTRHFKGDPDAPVTIIEFSDFQCPYCARFGNQTAPQIDEQYVEEGIVRMGYRHAAYHQGDAYLAAEASECAADQDAFWDYHDLLIDRLAVEQQNSFPQEVLTDFAAELDLDVDTFTTCLEEGTYADLVRNQTAQSREIGVSGTPTFMINGTFFVGAQPFENFQETIAAAQDGELEPSDTTPAEEEAENAEEIISQLVADTRHFKGDPDAPVTIIEFSDFQCPYCARFATETAPQITEQYIDEGLVRMGYRHAAYHEDEAYLAAEASECAADQDAFWDYHDLLIERLAVEQENSFPQEVLTDFAAELDLDVDTFTTCLEEGTYADLVRTQTQESQSLGVTGTPAFLINEQGVMGAQPFDVFEGIIESELP